MSTPVEKVEKAPAAGFNPAGSGLGSGATPSHRVRRVYSVEHGLYIRTRNPLLTLQKVTRRGFPAYLEYGAGWVLLTPDAVRELLESGEAVVPYMLEPPTFQGCKAYEYVVVRKEEVGEG
jgi:hypothetical protein